MTTKKHRAKKYYEGVLRLVVLTLFTILFLTEPVLAQSVTIGQMETRTGGSVGIRSSSADTTITNNGTIESTNNDSSGIPAPNARVTIINNGQITARGVHSEGIYSTGDDVNIDNRDSGTITATGLTPLPSQASAPRLLTAAE